MVCEDKAGIVAQFILDVSRVHISLSFLFVLFVPEKCAIIAHFSILGIVQQFKASDRYNPVILGGLYAGPGIAGLDKTGIQLCCFRALYAAPCECAAAHPGIHPCCLRALYTRHRHIQFPKGAGVISDLTDQPTEYSCFRDAMHLHRRKFRSYHPYSFFGGESGIRTHGCF